MARALGEILDAIAKSESKAPSEVAFVIDASGDQPIQGTLALALARYRAGTEQGGTRPRRAALVIGFKRESTWAARVAVPFTEDLFALGLETLRARESSGQLDEGGIGAVWSALDLVSELPWAPASRPHVILLSDDRRFCEREDALGNSGCPDADPSFPISTWGDRPPETDPRVPEQIREWARARRAVLHVVRCQLEGDDGNAGKDSTSPSIHPGTEFPWIAALFREGVSASPVTGPALIAALERALDSAQANAPNGVDALLIVHEKGSMNGELPGIKRALPVFQRFLSSEGRRLGLVRWGRARTSFSTASQFTGDPRTFAAALQSLRAGPAGDYPSDVWAALEMARNFGFRKTAKKAVILLDSAGASRGLDRDVVEWVERESIAVTFISP
jgi:hypothetical protein